KNTTELDGSGPGGCVLSRGSQMGRPTTARPARNAGARKPMLASGAATRRHGDAATRRRGDGGTGRRGDGATGRRDAATRRHGDLATWRLAALVSPLTHR